MTESRPDPRVEPLARLLHDDTCIDRPPFYCCRLRARDLLAAIDASPDIALMAQHEVMDYDGFPDLLRNPLTGDDTSMVPMRDRLLALRSREWSAGFHAGMAEARSSHSDVSADLRAAAQAVADLTWGHTADPGMKWRRASAMSSLRAALAATDASPDIALMRMGVEYPIARRLRVREAGAARGGSTRRSPYR